jgi:hypothetical protein
MLISDTAGNTATARKSFSVAAFTAAPEDTSPSVAAAPIFRAALVYTIKAGGSFSIEGAAMDPDGSVVSYKWTLMEVATGKVLMGDGARVAVPSVAAAGAYSLLITAMDGQGGAAEAAAKVIVSTVTGPPPSPSPAAVQAAVVSTPPPIYGSKLAVTLQLPARSFFQGAVMEVDPAVSGLFDLSSASWQGDLAASTCSLTLAPSDAPAAGGGATVFGCSTPARFLLATPGSFRLTLRVANKATGKTASTSSAIAVTTKPFWSDYYTAASPQGFVTGRCATAQLVGTEFAPLVLSCSGVTLPVGWGADAGLDVAKQQLAFAWKLTPLTARAAAAHKTPLTRSSTGGGTAAFGAVAAGLYLAEVAGFAGGAGGVSTSSVNSVYYLSTLLVVAPTAALVLAAPKPSCAGAAVTLTAAAPTVLAGQSAAAARWTVEWQDAKAATGKALMLAGSGATFSLVLQPGRYFATATVDVTDSGVVRRLAGRATIDARPCVACALGPVILHAAAESCTAAAADADKLLAGLPPAWVGTAAQLSFAAGSNLSPGTRALTIVARSVATNVTASCTVQQVTVRDATPPEARLRKVGGECAAPANGKWACWPLAALADSSDTCGAVQVQATCAGSTDARNCRLPKDGRVCIRAAMPAAGRDSTVLGLDLAFRDEAGNARNGTIRVPVTVYRTARAGCSPPTLASPPS